MKKANYSAITGMILVIVIIVGYIAYTGFNLILFETKKPSEIKSRQYSDAKLFYSNLLNCHGQGNLNVDILNDNTCEDLIFGHVVGYRVIQETFGECDKFNWNFSETSDQVIVYNVIIENENLNCIGRLLIFTD